MKTRGLALVALVCFGGAAFAQAPCASFKKNESITIGKGDRFAWVHNGSTFDEIDYQTAQNAKLADTSGTYKILAIYQKHNITGFIQNNADVTWPASDNMPASMSTVDQPTGLYTTEIRVYQTSRFDMCTGLNVPIAPELAVSGDFGNYSPSFHTDGLFVLGTQMAAYATNSEGLTVPRNWRGSYVVRIAYNGIINGGLFVNGVERDITTFTYTMRAGATRGDGTVPGDGSTNDGGTGIGDFGKLFDPNWWLSLIFPTKEQWEDMKTQLEATSMYLLVSQAVNFFVDLKTFIDANSTALGDTYRLEPVIVHSTAPGDETRVFADVDLTFMGEGVKLARMLMTAALYLMVIFKLRSIAAGMFDLSNLQTSYGGGGMSGKERDR